MTSTGKKTAIGVGIAGSMALFAFIFRNKTIDGLGSAKVVRTYHSVNRARPSCKNKMPGVFVTEKVILSKSKSKVRTNVQLDAKWDGIYQFSR